MIVPSDTATRLLLWGIVIHLFCDWVLQNHWMAENKYRFAGPRDYLRFLGPAPVGEGPLFLLPHPAAFVHASIHGVTLLLIFPWPSALIIAVIHLLIDTRVPLSWWRKFYKQTTTGDMALHVAIWGDQVLHIFVLAIVALLVGGAR
jgi:hypothetical protein